MGAASQDSALVSSDTARRGLELSSGSIGQASHKSSSTPSASQPSSEPRASLDGLPTNTVIRLIRAGPSGSGQTIALPFETKSLTFAVLLEKIETKLGRSNFTLYYAGSNIVICSQQSLIDAQPLHDALTRPLRR